MIKNKSKELAAIQKEIAKLEAQKAKLERDQQRTGWKNTIALCDEILDSVIDKPFVFNVRSYDIAAAKIKDYRKVKVGSFSLYVDYDISLEIIEMQPTYYKRYLVSNPVRGSNGIDLLHAMKNYLAQFYNDPLAKEIYSKSEEIEADIKTISEKCTFEPGKTRIPYNLDNSKRFKFDE